MEPKRNLVDNGWVLNRANLEVNAPQFDEMVLQSYADYPESVDQRRAFRVGWQQIRSGKRPRIPDKYKNVPELADAYRAGVEWSRRPD